LYDDLSDLEISDNRLLLLHARLAGRDRTEKDVFRYYSERTVDRTVETPQTLSTGSTPGFFRIRKEQP
jgi:hypothetical protein